MQHLTERQLNELLKLETVNQREKMRHTLKIVSNAWPRIEEWAMAPIQLRLQPAKTTLYWAAWAYVNGHKLDAEYLRSCTFNHRRFLSVTGACDVEQAQSLLFKHYKTTAIWSDLVRLLLFSGKRTVKSLTENDLHQAIQAEVIPDSAAARVQASLWLLGVIEREPPKYRRPTKEIVVPDRIAPHLAAFARSIALARSVAPERYERKVQLELGRFFEWWQRQYPDRLTLTDMKRSNWLTYVQHVRQWPVSGKHQYDHLSAVRKFLAWGMAEDEEVMAVMPSPAFPVVNTDYQDTWKNHRPTKDLGFADPDHGDQIIRYVLQDWKPTDPVERMRRAAIIVAATSGARVSEIRRIGYRHWLYDEVRKVWKIILPSADKMLWDRRPILVTKEGIDALEEIARLRDELGSLRPRRDPRTKREYVHLFEYRGKLVVDASGCNQVLGRIKLHLNLKDEFGNPVKGGMHAWRHRMADHAFLMSDGDLRVLQHLLGHVDMGMSRQYGRADRPLRAAQLRDQVRLGKVAGKAKDLLIWALGQDLLPDHLTYLQKALESPDARLLDLVRNGSHNLGFGLCMAAECPKRNACESCGNFLALEEHTPTLKRKLLGTWAILCVLVQERYNGNIEAAMEDPQLRGYAYTVEDMKHHLEDLGVDRNDILTLLGLGGHGTDTDTAVG